MCNRLTTIVVLCGLISVAALAAQRDWIEVGQHSTITSPGGDQTRTLFQFDLDGIQGANVDYAAIELQFACPADSADHYVVRIHPMATSWTESADWSTSFNSPGGDFVDDVAVLHSVSRKRGYRVRVFLTEIVQLWTTEQIPNSGLIIISEQPGIGKAQLKAGLFDEQETAPKIEVYSSNR